MNHDLISQLEEVGAADQHHKREDLHGTSFPCVAFGSSFGEQKGEIEETGKPNKTCKNNHQTEEIVTQERKDTDGKAELDMEDKKVIRSVRGPKETGCVYPLK